MREPIMPKSLFIAERNPRCIFSTGIHPGYILMASHAPEKTYSILSHRATGPSRISPNSSSALAYSIAFRLRNRLMP